MKLLSARVLILGALGIWIPAIAYAQSGVPVSPRVQPKQVPVADTRLIMEGINLVNYKGLEKMLRTKPEDADAWGFARGQALLIAEAGNLLTLRPPKNQGQELWMKTSVELRESAARLARAASAQDLNNSRARLVEVANTCNKCHQAFKVSLTLAPFRVEEKPVPMFPQ